MPGSLVIRVTQEKGREGGKKRGNESNLTITAFLCSDSKSVLFSASSCTLKAHGSNRLRAQGINPINQMTSKLNGTRRKTKILVDVIRAVIVIF